MSNRPEVLEELPEVPLSSGTEPGTFQITPRHSYYIKPCEHSGMKIIPITLGGTKNYEQWKRSMTVALSTSNKLGFVNGTIEVPRRNSEMFIDYSCANETVVAWIYNTLEPTIFKT